MIRKTTLLQVCALLLFVTRAAAVFAQQPGSLTGLVVDALGARVADVSVTLVGERRQAATTRSGSDGTYHFDNIEPGRYQVSVSAQGFQTVTSEPVYLSPGSRQSIDVTLQIGPLEQELVVTAAATEIPQSQTGAPVTVIDAQLLDALNKPDVLEALRLVPGSQIVQTGGRGGLTSMFVRGGASNFNKVLIDGVAANDIGGAFDFGQVSTTGVQGVEVLRQTNSVMYGSDALAGVVSVTTSRGRSRIPELSVSADGGNLGTFSTQAGFGGAVKRFDYFSAVSHFETDNDVPNNAFQNDTYSGRFSVAFSKTDLTGTLRHTETDFGSPNGLTMFGIADDSESTNHYTYGTVTAQTQWSNKWQSLVRFGSVEQTLHSVNPTPTGQAYDPFGFGANYLGNQVTLTGANGYSVTGQAILDYSATYPSRFASRTTRRVLNGEATYQATDALAVSGGVRYEREEGFDDPDNPTAEATATRNNGGAFGEVRATLLNRLYVSAGLGIEHNAAFGEAVTPRVSVALYARQPASTGLGDTKIVLNAGTGIKAPNIFQEQNSLFALVNGLPAGAGVEPIGPERSQSFDVGVEQGLAGGRARARVAYFHNDFDDLVEYLSKSALILAGVPPAVANSTAFGAYINSQSYRAQGVEASLESALRSDLRLMASYTRLNAEVTDAFSASASFNPSFPTIPIGAYSPLVGQRPFRRPTNSGTFALIYTPGPAEVALSAYFAGKRDDSTFLSDQFFGSSMLLPNRDLDPAYQKFDVSASYRVHPRVRGYISIENLFDQKYEASFGFPSLPLTARAGVRLTLGGDPPRRP